MRVRLGAKYKFFIFLCIIITTLNQFIDSHLSVSSECFRLYCFGVPSLTVICIKYKKKSRTHATMRVQATVL